MIYSHTLGAVVNGGTSSANGAQISCGATAAVTAVQCVIGTSCGAVIGFSGGASGIGVSVSFPPSSIFSTSKAYSRTCLLIADPQYSGCGSDSEVPCGQTGGGGGCLCDTEGCPGREQCDDDTCLCVNMSPIIVDTTGKGFKLTSADAGVVFDMLGNGHPSKMAWTAAGSGNAFLALDRNHNGKIDSGKELFGNLTDQPSSSERNGFSALAVFDQPENGGNGDGIIDWHDAVYSRLVLWIDENQDGISQVNELHTQQELGVFSISLHYRDVQRYDEYGNWFHYRAALNPNSLDGESKDGRWLYDVFFEVDKKTNGPASAARKPNLISAAEHRLH